MFFLLLSVTFRFFWNLSQLPRYLSKNLQLLVLLVDCLKLCYCPWSHGRLILGWYWICWWWVVFHTFPYVIYVLLKFALGSCFNNVRLKLRVVSLALPYFFSNFFFISFLRLAKLPVVLQLINVVNWQIYFLLQRFYFRCYLSILVKIFLGVFWSALLSHLRILWR